MGIFFPGGDVLRTCSLFFLPLLSFNHEDLRWNSFSWRWCPGTTVRYPENCQRQSPRTSQTAALLNYIALVSALAACMCACVAKLWMKKPTVVCTALHIHACAPECSQSHLLTYVIDTHSIIGEPWTAKPPTDQIFTKFTLY